MAIYQSLKDRLKNQHEAIRFLIENTDEPTLIKHPEPNKWSIKDNIAHLTKYQPVFLDRINLILQSDKPLFERYIAENDPEFETFRNYELSYLLLLMDSNREKIYNTVINLSEQELNRIGIHQKFGELTIIKWTEFFLLHEAHHLFTIFQIANSIK